MLIVNPISDTIRNFIYCLFMRLFVFTKVQNLFKRKLFVAAIKKPINVLKTRGKLNIENREYTISTSINVPDNQTREYFKKDFDICRLDFFIIIYRF